MPTKLPVTLPWTQYPLIINAPMAGFATAPLAIAVTKAGGLGQIGSAFDMNELETNLAEASKQLEPDSGLLPVGVGFLPFICPLEKAIPLLKKHKPAVVWLFAAKESADYGVWAKAVREVSPNSQIWVQVGSVKAALEVANAANPDVLCVQGSDAGGHGFEKGAGIISLLPEIVDALATADHRNIGLVAAGGIVDGRGVAAALALGARGVVLGTAFLAAEETVVPEGYRKAVLTAKDGGTSTVRDKVFDNLTGPNIWPGMYDGRSIVTESYTDQQSGVSIEEIRRLHAEAKKDGNLGYGLDGKGRAVVWAGTGVGLVKEKQPAKTIVEQARHGAKAILHSVAAKL